MKKLILAAALSMASLANAKTMYLETTDIVSLNDDQNSLRIMVAYPGEKLSGLCDIELRSDKYTPAALSKLLDKVSINHVFSKNEKQVTAVNHNVLRIALIPGTYLDGFEIRTKDGSSLRKTIQDTFAGEPGQRSLVAIARTCP